MFDFLPESLSNNWADSALFLGFIFFIILGALRGFGRTFVYSLIFFVSAVFALWWFTPYLTTFDLDNIPALLINLLYFWAGNTAIAWLATKIVMALDNNGTGALSRLGGAIIGGIYAIGLLITANIAYAIAIPDADRLSSLPKTLETSEILNKSDATATHVHTFLNDSGYLETLTSRELDPEEEDSGKLTE